MADDETERLMHTVRQMLDFYRPSALDRKSEDVNGLIRRVIKLLETQLNDYQIRVNLKLAKDLPMVLIVENQIQQVFFNIFLNAIEAMPDGGEISITTFQEQNHVTIQIEDTGMGIREDQREEIFEPFVSSKERGLGLGLTVSYGVVTAHGGSLILMPPSEQGACFKLSLPAYPSSREK
jgi:signal transduction histidine kinase